MKQTVKQKRDNLTDQQAAELFQRRIAELQMVVAQDENPDQAITNLAWSMLGLIEQPSEEDAREIQASPETKRKVFEQMIERMKETEKSFYNF